VDRRNPAVRSRIASLVVSGTVSGNPTGVPGLINGVVAQQIGMVKISGATLEITPNTPATDWIF